MKTPPLLLIVYNRPTTTKKLLEALSKQKPNDIFVFCDGPKNNSDKSLVAETRKLFDKVPWTCNITRNFQNNNLGCEKGPVDAISWFFKNVPEGMILEDDCIPNKSFFKFTTSLLEKYRSDTRISMISGSNQGFKSNTSDSYFYSRYSITWGWATWANRWQLYDSYFDIKKEVLFSKNNIKACKQFDIGNKFISCIKKSYEGKIDAWDYLWSYFNLIENKLSVIPTHNFVKNVGFGKGATHTKIETSLSKIETKNISKKISHPLFFIDNNKFSLHIARTNSILFIIFDIISLRIKKFFK